MPQLFGIDIAGEINNAMGADLLDVTLIKSTAGTRTPGSLTAGVNPTTVSYTGKGFTDSYKEYQMTGTLIQVGDKKVAILGASLPPGIVPQTNDTIICEGITYNTVRVERDPAAALYECQVRGTSA